MFLIYSSNKFFISASVVKSFGVLNEENHYSIVLIPKQRFGARMTVFFPETEGEQIVDFFGERLPMEEVKLDLIDKLVRWLRI